MKNLIQIQNLNHFPLLPLMLQEKALPNQEQERDQILLSPQFFLQKNQRSIQAMLHTKTEWKVITEKFQITSKDQIQVMINLCIQ